MAKLPHRKCANKECRQWFHPIREGQIVCSYQCASAVGKEQTRKAREAAQRKAQSLQRAAEKKERAAWRQRKAAVKPLKHWIDLTQRAVNDICRETELAEGLGCISCGTKTAFAWHAGHYRSTAAAGQPLRRQRRKRRQPHRQPQQKYLRQTQQRQQVQQRPAQQPPRHQHRRHPITPPHLIPAHHWRRKAVLLPEQQPPEQKMPQNGQKTSRT